MKHVSKFAQRVASPPGEAAMTKVFDQLVSRNHGLAWTPIMDGDAVLFDYNGEALAVLMYQGSRFRIKYRVGGQKMSLPVRNLKDVVAWVQDEIDDRSSR